MPILEKRQTYSGNGVAQRTWFEAISDTKPADAEIVEAQKELGYHPAGYGGPNGIKTTEENGQFKTVWCCWSSCD